MQHQVKCDGCDHLVTGADDAEVKARLAEHVKAFHNLSEIPTNDATKAKESKREAGEGFKAAS